MRRQSEGWNDAEKKLKNRGMRLLKKWEKVAHAVDIGNNIKKMSRNKLSYYGRGNLISSFKEIKKPVKLISNDELVAMIEDIVYSTNVAYTLADENVKINL